MLTKSVKIIHKCLTCDNTIITWVLFTATLALVEHDYIKHGLVLCTKCYQSEMEPIFLECELATKADAKVENPFGSV